MDFGSFMSIFAQLPTVITAIQAIMNSDAAHTVESAVSEWVNHNTPGQPNSPALSQTAKG